MSGTIQPYKTSVPRGVNTIFGPVVIEGPFADDYTRLNWQYDDHWSGESARFRVAGLETYVKDCDGDNSFWTLKDIRTRKIIAQGSDGGFDPPHFFACLALAEAALRQEVQRRKTAISRRVFQKAPMPLAEAAECCGCLHQGGGGGLEMASTNFSDVCEKCPLLIQRKRHDALRAARAL